MKRHALFVGVNSYDDKTIRPLRFSIPDASVLADRFGQLGFATTLLSDPTGAELKQAVKRTSKGLGPGDVYLFFFAGHGFTAQDGTHLLFCRDDQQELLRCNSAGVRIDALEYLTDKGGFHRAFLLDSCRTDSFAGVEARGGETRDLDLVAMPEALPDSGTFFLLRSCDKFRPSLEIADLGHGLFTQGLLDAMAASDPALARCGDDFAGAVRDRMEILARHEGIALQQRPVSEINGPAFSLFDESFLSSAARPAMPAPPVAAAPPPPPPPRSAPVRKSPSNAAGSEEPEFVDAIRRICAEERIAGWKCLYVGDGIPRRKLQNFVSHAVECATEGTGVSDWEGVLSAAPIALCDYSIGGSGRTGFLFTRKGIAISGDSTWATRAACQTWAEFAEPSGGVSPCASKHEILLHKGKGVCLNIALSTRSNRFMLAFFQCIRDVAAGRTSERSPAHASLRVASRRENSGLAIFAKMVKFFIFCLIVGVAIGAAIGIHREGWSYPRRVVRSILDRAGSKDVVLPEPEIPTVPPASGANRTERPGGNPRRAESDPSAAFAQWLDASAGAVEATVSAMEAAGPTPADILAAFSKIRSPRFWTGKAIPARLGANARDKMGTGELEILALCDNSSAGDASEGFAVTASGIHYRNNPSSPFSRLGGDSGAGFVPWSDVWPDENQFVESVLVLSGHPIDCSPSTLDKVARRHLVEALDSLSGKSRL
jgi:hypothetical protein